MRPARWRALPWKREVHRRRSRRRLVLGAAALLLLPGLVAAVGWLTPAPPSSLYEPATVTATGRPGMLLEAEPVELGLLDELAAWRVRYRTTGPGGAPADATALVLLPPDPPPGPRPVVVAAHGSVGIDRRCAPSLSPRPLQAIPGASGALEAGWIVVAPDYQGLGTPGPHPYLVGDVTAFTVLDAARALGDLAERTGHGTLAGVAETPSAHRVYPDLDRLALWGFSQGGHAVLWAGELAASYAPELALTGVVAFAPATDLVAQRDAGLDSVPGALLAVHTIVAWSGSVVDEPLEQLLPPAQVADARAVAEHCLDPIGLPRSVPQAALLRAPLVDAGVLHRPSWEAALEANTPAARSRRRCWWSRAAMTPGSCPA